MTGFQPIYRSVDSMSQEFPWLKAGECQLYMGKLYSGESFQIFCQKVFLSIQNLNFKSIFRFFIYQFITDN